MAENKIKRTLTQEQKTGFVLMLLFGLLTVGLGFLEMRQNLYEPFLAQRVAFQQSQPTISSLADEATRLQQIDTDRDGLNDYEEIQFYGTSAYIPDTDSDGISDKQEIDGGKDPLCAEGQACASAETSPVNSTSTVFSPLGGGNMTAEDLLRGATAGVTASGTLDVATLSRDPAAVRQLLLSTGSVTEDQLKNISDADLMRFVEEAMGATSPPTTP